MWAQEQYENDRFADYNYGLEEYKVDEITAHLSDAFEYLGVVNESNEDLHMALTRIANIVGFMPSTKKEN